MPPESNDTAYLWDMLDAARKVSENFQNAHPEIPWRRIIGQRHVLAHEYGDIEPGIIWKLLKTRIPELAEKLEPIVPPLPDEGAF